MTKPSKQQDPTSQTTAQEELEQKLGLLVYLGGPPLLKWAGKKFSEWQARANGLPPLGPKI